MSSALMVVAIDFGTSYSGYAFSTRNDFQRDPLKIHVNQAWNSGKKQLLSLKTPTCLLLDKKKEIVSFGYEAEDAYAELVLDEKHHDYYFFERFKMKLFQNKVLIALISFTFKQGIRSYQGKFFYDLPSYSN
jgi:hypothetical protein